MIMGGGRNVADVIRFGTDGWRGVIAEDFTFSNLRRAVAGTIAFLQRNRPARTGPLLIGYDRRFLSRSFAQFAGLCFKQNGFLIKVARSPIPTPALSACVVSHKALWGFMITASHNPAIYNGFKIKEESGRSAPTEVTSQIESLIPETSSSSPLPQGDVGAPNAVGEASPLPTFDYLKDYESYLRQRLDWKVLQRVRARVVLDHLYGVAAGIPEALLKKSAITFFSLHAEDDPLFGGLHPEPIESNLTALQKEIRRQRALVGFAFDGDADRLGVMDEAGRYLTPHQVFPLLLLYGIEQKGLRGKVVQSVSLGALGERIAQTHHLPFEEVPVGFKHVAQRMVSEDILAGGEESGGYAFKGGLPERDGILSALFFLEMLATSGKTPSQLLRAMEKRFGAARFKRRDIPLKQPIYDKGRFTSEISSRLPDRIAGQNVARIRTQDGIKVILADGAWVLLRPSGTEPLLRTYAESDQWTRTDRLLALSRQWVEGMTNGH
jgi:phosphomannomutase